MSKSTKSKAKIPSDTVQLPFELTDKLYSAQSEEELVDVIYNLLHKEFAIIECNIFIYGNSNRLEQLKVSHWSDNLDKQAKYLVEEGVTDWLSNYKKSATIPNLRETDSGIRQSILLVPFYQRGKCSGIFIAFLNIENTAVTDSMRQNLDFLFKHTAIVLSNLRSTEELSNMNNRLRALNNQILISSKLASLGTLAGTFAEDISSPLNVIEANLQLIESGIDDSSRRFEIIKEQITNIKDINSRLSKLAENSGDKDYNEINLCSLAEEVLLFATAFLQRDGIDIILECEDKDLSIKGSKAQLEQVLLNILLFSREKMPDGGSIILTVLKRSGINAGITISDNGIGFTEEETALIFEPDFSVSKSQPAYGGGLFSARSILKQHRGNISVYSEIGKGTTFKVLLPISSK